MEGWVTVFWIALGLIVLIWLLVTITLCYLIYKIGFRNLKLLLTTILWVKAYRRYRDRFFR